MCMPIALLVLASSYLNPIISQLGVPIKNEAFLSILGELDKKRF